MSRQFELPLRKRFAFCTVALALLLSGASGSGQPLLRNNLSLYQKKQLSMGAKKFRLLSQLAYCRAIASLEEGERKRAILHLKEALELNPDYPDAYFTLAKLEIKRFSSDTFYYLARAIDSVRKDFHYQSLVLVNGALAVILLLFMLSCVFGIALALKYLPFSAHRVQEFLRNKWGASHAALASYALLLVPFVLFPGFISGIALVTILSWFFLSRREKFALSLIIFSFVALGIFSPKLKEMTPLVNPKSFTSLIAKANESPGDYSLVRTIEKTPAASLEGEKNLALGLLHLRDENFLAAAEYLLKAISASPTSSMGYVNLGNVYYLQGEFEKALEGYRKGEAVDSLNPICQYNLAQACIKTLLLAESSTALKRASVYGIEKVKTSYAPVALGTMQVFPQTFSNAELWRIARVEGKSSQDDFFRDVLVPITRFPPVANAWILAGALLVAVLLSRFIDHNKLTFQCSNCGRLACLDCCDDERGSYLCRECAEGIGGVSSEKVIEALLRQRRQSVVVKRRRSIRLLTLGLPGVRDIFYGRILRGLSLGVVFGFSTMELFSRGLIIKDWDSVLFDTALWKIVLPALGVVSAYAVSIFSRQVHDARSYRTPMPGKLSERLSLDRKPRRAAS